MTTPITSGISCFEYFNRWDNIVLTTMSMKIPLFKVCIGLMLVTLIFFAKLVKIVKNRKKSRMSKDDSKYKSLRVSLKQYITVM